MKKLFEVYQNKSISSIFLKLSIVVDVGFKYRKQIEQRFFFVIFGVCGENTQTITTFLCHAKKNLPI